MSDGLTSFRKTVWLAAGATLTALLATWLVGAAMPAWTPRVIYAAVLVAMVAVVLAAAGTTFAGLLVIYRALRNDRGDADLFDCLNATRSESSLAAQGDRPNLVSVTRILRRAFGAPRHLVGDGVRVRSLQEILATLDDHGCLDSLPFMPEMLPFCGQWARVFRVVDKVYDYGGRKELRRMKNVVSLAGLRCNGGGHGDCQAGCSLMWHVDWLEPATQPGESGFSGHRPLATLSFAGRTREWLQQQSQASAGADGAVRYRCQYTQVVAASQTLTRRDPRQDLRPWLAGNVTLAAWVVALLTRWFNRVQALRGGVSYPARPPSIGNATSRIDKGIDVGDRVEVVGAGEIAATLDRTGRNRGLWFDRDMLKHCHRRHRIEAVVERLIDDSTGMMRVMKTRCCVLEGVSASGEFLRFCPQHDLPLWREAWLRRIPADTAQGDAESP